MINFFDQFNEFNENSCLNGMNDDFFALYVTSIFKKNRDNILIVTSTLYEANKLYRFISNYTDSALLFPMDDFLTSESVAVSPELKITRLETINEILKSKKIVITDLNGYLRFLPTKKIYKKNILNIKVGDVVQRDTFIKDLVRLGYNRETIVSQTGEFSIRGYIIDIFGLGENHPCRLEFFDDEIESIRYFDEDTQKSIENIKNITLFPNTEFLVFKETAETSQKYLEKYLEKIVNIYDYLDNPIVFFKDYTQIKASYEKLLLDILEYKNSKDLYFNGRYMFNLEELFVKKEYFYNTINSVKSKNSINIDIKKPPLFYGDVNELNAYIIKELYLNHTIILSLNKNQQKKYIKEIDFTYHITNLNNIYPSSLNIIDLNLENGFIYDNYIFLGQKEIFNEKHNYSKYKTKYKYSTKIKSLENINIGDYVVHNIHGIGIYNGIKALRKKDIVKDYIEVLYYGGDKLYIPVEKIEYISKFSGKEGVVPKINKLGTSDWAKTKLRVRTKIQDIANKLIKLYASREVMKGFKFSKDGELQVLFEDKFPYELTPDQEKAIGKIKKDMESIKPMDMLLCGDVGYGKTEVAFRAMFKAVNDSKQVMYLCPTTILSSQQYKNAIERFKDFPIEIRLLNRFVSYSDARKTVEEFNEGKIDILFGTHRILSEDIKPKDLGLLVIDEEHKFGVVHKEKIKEYKNNVDVLTLTATPIPRTLQMSLIGIRGLSLIETPPKNRYPVQTYVMDENDQIIRDVIYKEMARGGQVFILYNRVERIERKVEIIKELVSDARITYAHGQMSKNELEDRMMDFIEHKADVLICTTIIENGIDIPNVNTLIVIDADRFGLSQLYQIRGRVGRSNRIAYCYLMYNGSKILTETAIKRLNVIKEFTALGSGFSIATRDLSIRGAGDVLGSEQAGFIDNVGIDLYLKILDEEVKKLKGEKIEEEKEMDERPLLDVSTHIDDSIVDNDDLKIEIHKRINEIDSEEKLISVRAELEDRFGKVDEGLIIYMHEELFEKKAKAMQIENVVQTDRSIELIFSENITNRIDVEELFVSSYKISNMFTFKTRGRQLVIVLGLVNLEKHYIYILLELLNIIKLKEE